MGFPPEAFIIGAQKSGTTFLANLLDQHSKITLSDPKEPDYFTRNLDMGLDWYKSIFVGPGDNIFLDASTSYTAARLPGYNEEDSQTNPHLTDIPYRIFSLSPKAKFIYIVRNPIERTYSSYWHNVRFGTEKNTFRDAIEGNSFYLRLSDYSGQLKLYLEHFPMDSFLVLLFEDIKEDPVGTAQKCFRFLGLEEKSDLELMSGRNKSFQYQGWTKSMDTALAKFGGINSIIKLVKPFVSSNTRNILAKLITKKIPPMDAKDRDFLLNYFKDKNLELKEMFGVSIEKWMS